MRAHVIRRFAYSTHATPHLIHTYRHDGNEIRKEIGLGLSWMRAKRAVVLINRIYL